MFYIDIEREVDMLSHEEKLEIWKTNSPPPSEYPFSYDAFVVIEVSNITIAGEVRWDHIIQQYVFQPGTSSSDTTFELYELTLSQESYVQFRQII